MHASPDTKIVSQVALFVSSSFSLIFTEAHRHNHLSLAVILWCLLEMMFGCHIMVAFEGFAVFLLCAAQSKTLHLSTSPLKVWFFFCPLVSTSQREGAEDSALDVGGPSSSSGTTPWAWRRTCWPPGQATAQGSPGADAVCEVGQPLLLALFLGQRAAGEREVVVVSKSLHLRSDLTISTCVLLL